MLRDMTFRFSLIENKNLQEGPAARFIKLVNLAEFLSKHVAIYVEVVGF